MRASSFAATLPESAAIQLWDRDEENGGSKIGLKIKVAADATKLVDFDLPFGMVVYLEVVAGTVEVAAYKHGA